MSKRSRTPELELKRLLRQVKLNELKYQFAVEDGRTSDQERIIKKTERLAERIGKLRAGINHQYLMDWVEAIEINKALDKEKEDGLVQRNPDSRESN